MKAREIYQANFIIGSRVDKVGHNLYLLPMEQTYTIFARRVYTTQPIVGTNKRKLAATVRRQAEELRQPGEEAIWSINKLSESDFPRLMEIWAISKEGRLSHHQFR